MIDDLEGVSIFVAVAEARGFRAAGERLGVTGSAVSQAIRRLEARLGIALLMRTTRSVRLTEAGERYYRAVGPALDEVRAAGVAVSELADTPRGTLRLSVSASAVSFLRGSALEGFLRAFPLVQLDLTVGGVTEDIVAAGYDAGVRLGEVIDQDMITVPASGPQRMLVVASPQYLARHPAPRHPRELAGHACINWHSGPGQPVYRWEFTENGHDFAVTTQGRVVTNDVPLLIQLARAGAGLAMVIEELVRPDLETGELLPVLEEFSTPFPGFYLYYPQRRQASPALRALIEHLLQNRQR